MKTISEDDVLKFAYNKAYLEVEDNEDIIDQEGYAKFMSQFENEHRGKAKCMNSVRLYKNIDISSQLELISNKETECALIIAFMNGSINDLICISSNEDNKIHAENYFIKTETGESAVDFMLRWINNGAQICNYHNHPMTIAALPSKEDINSLANPYPISVEEWNIAAKRYKKTLPAGFKYDDWGIVTPFDFFSYKQEEKKGHNIEWLLKQEKNSKMQSLEGRKKFVIENSKTYISLELEICNYYETCQD